MAQTTAHPFPIVDIDAHPPLSPRSVHHIGELDESLFFSRLTRAGINIACGRLTPPPGSIQTEPGGESYSFI